MARQLVQCTLPHSDPGNVQVWTRTNGHLTLAIRPYVDLKTQAISSQLFMAVPRQLKGTAVRSNAALTSHLLGI